MSFKLPRLPALAFLAILGLVFASCAPWNATKGQSLLTFSSGSPRSLKLILSRDGFSVFGTWEEASLARYGLVEGNSKDDGSLRLTFFAAATGAPVGHFSGKYLGGEKAIEGDLSLGSSESVKLRLDQGQKLNLRQASLQALSRKGLPAKEEPGHFWFVALEPSSPGAFRTMYRKTFQEGRSLATSMAAARDGVIADFGAAAETDPEAAKSWVYDARQFPSYVGESLLVLGLRVGVVSGGRVLEQSLRYSVLDTRQVRRLGPQDFLVEGWEAQLPELLARSAREELGLEEGSSLAQVGLTLDLPLPSPDFLVYSQGLGFHYPPGALAPDGAGDFFILLPFDRLGSLVKPGVLEAYRLGGGTKG